MSSQIPSGGPGPAKPSPTSRHSSPQTRPPSRTQSSTTSWTHVQTNRPGTSRHRQPRRAASTATRRRQVRCHRQPAIPAQLISPHANPATVRASSLTPTIPPHRPQRHKPQPTPSPPHSPPHSRPPADPTPDPAAEPAADPTPHLPADLPADPTPDLPADPTTDSTAAITSQPPTTTIFAINSTPPSSPSAPTCNCRRRPTPRDHSPGAEAPATNAQLLVRLPSLPVCPRPGSARACPRSEFAYTASIACNACRPVT